MPSGTGGIRVLQVFSVGVRARRSRFVKQATATARMQVSAARETVMKSMALPTKFFSICGLIQPVKVWLRMSRVPEGL